MRVTRFLPLLILVVSGVSCASPPPENNKIISQFKGELPTIIQNDSGLFHGLMLGMSEVDVKKNAHAYDSLAVEQPNYLQFEHAISAKKNFVYECEFDNRGLSAITMDVFLEDEKTGDSLYNEFNRYFTMRYGKPEDSGSHLTWTTTTGNRPAKIELEVDPDYMYGKLTIWFYDKSFDAPEPGNDSTNLPIL